MVWPLLPMLGAAGSLTSLGARPWTRFANRGIRAADFLLLLDEIVAASGDDQAVVFVVDGAESEELIADVYQLALRNGRIERSRLVVLYALADAPQDWR